MVFIGGVHVVRGALDDGLAPGAGEDVAVFIERVAVSADDEGVAARGELAGEMAEDIGLIDVGGAAVGGGALGGFGEGETEAVHLAVERAVIGAKVFVDGDFGAFAVGAVLVQRGLEGALEGGAVGVVRIEPAVDEFGEGEEGAAFFYLANHGLG